MTLADLLDLWSGCPLIASAQADPGTPCATPETLSRLARASLDQGVRMLRMQGVENLRSGLDLGVPVIGLIKRDVPGSEVYITPDLADVEALLALGVPVIALDGTARGRPGSDLAALIQRVHAGGALAMADCDSLESARFARVCGADLVGTTLAGYTRESRRTDGPDFELLRALVAELDVPIIAEGRYARRWEVEAALRIGASAVVVGGALNDPVKQTRSLLPAAPPVRNLGAVDIGGTWLRFGVFSPDWQLQGEPVRIPNPRNRHALLDWIRARIAESGVGSIGVSTGGIVDPVSGEVWTAKEYLMPDHIGVVFSEDTLGVPTWAFGDGHATAWGHANLPVTAGKRVATLALGTGVGAGFVQEGRIWCGRRGEYPRINDLPAAGGRTYEELLGGIHLSRDPSPEALEHARQALHGAVQAVRDLYFPDEVVIGGSVGLSDWLRPEVEALGLVVSPFGGDAGLYGAAALARFPTWR